VVGEEKSVSAIIAEVAKDVPFYRNSAGGVTLSGGEPFAQPDFLRELLPALKNLAIPVSVETCLHVPWKQIQANLSLMDVFLADVKHADSEKFKQFTGGNLTLILTNLRKLAEINASVIVRIPVIPGFNQTEAEMRGILDIAAALPNVREVHFMPYHALGSAKYALSGRTYDFPMASLSEEDMQSYLEYARQNGLTSNVGG
jgi:pyruvate formate lyase activating enzyme